MHAVSTQPAIANQSGDAAEFPQHAHVYWSGQTIQMRTAGGRLLAEACIGPCGDFSVVAFDSAGAAYREKAFHPAEAAMLLNLFVAVEMAARS